MNYRVDKRDLAIIEAKERRPSVTLMEIADSSGYAFSTIQNRHQRLIDRGILRYRVEVDRGKIAEVS